MKYILKSPLIITSQLIIILLGFSVGNKISDNFIELYASKLTQPYVRYLFIVIMIFDAIQIYRYQYNNAFILRRKKYLNLRINITKYIIYILSLSFINFNIPVLVQNYKLFLSNINIIFMFIINCIIISLFILSLIDLLNAFVKNRAVSSSIILTIIAILDFMLQHINFNFIENVSFDISYIFSIPYIYNNFYIYDLIILIISLNLFLLSIYLEFKNDYLLENYYEEN